MYVKNTKTPIVLHKFREIIIKFIIIMIQAQNWKKFVQKYFQLSFSPKIEMPQLGSAQEIPGRTHHYVLVIKVSSETSPNRFLAMNIC